MEPKATKNPESVVREIKRKTRRKFSFGLSPPPLVEDPDRFYRSGEK